MPSKDPFGAVAAGELRKRVVFQDYVEVQSVTGAVSPSWVNIITAWARIEPLSGRELYQAQQIYPETTTQITVRGVVGKMLDPRMRMLFEGRQFDIIDITDIDERRVETLIMAKERPVSRAA